MSFSRQVIFLFVAITAVAAGAPLIAAEPHNLILFIPEALPTTGANPANAPALVRLRQQGVSFVNSHSGFPQLTASASAPTSDLDTQMLLNAAAGRYATAVVNDVRDSGDGQSSVLRAFLEVGFPRLKSAGRPFFVVYRLAEPPYSPPAGNEVRPAFKVDPGPADRSLEAIEARLKALGLYDTTNIIIAAQHSFARVLKVSTTSSARVLLRREEELGTLPPGFLAIDVLAAIQTEDAAFNLFDPDHGTSYVDVTSGGHPQRGNAVIAEDYDPAFPFLTVHAHGAYDSIFLSDSLPKKERKAMAGVILEALFEQDYVGSVFVNEKRVGGHRGAVALSHITPAVRGAARHPDIVVAFAVVNDGCIQPLLCTSVIADTPLAEGEGIPNSFSRAGTSTFLAARGPDFQSGRVSQAPASHADVMRTIAELLQVRLDTKHLAPGRVLTESLSSARGANVSLARPQMFDSEPSIEGRVTEVHLQFLRGLRYFDAGLARKQRLVQAEAPRRSWKWLRPRSLSITISDDNGF